MNKRALRLDDLGISKELYNELRWFCRQHPKKVAALNAVRGGFSDLRLNDMPRDASISDPTASRAVRVLNMGIRRDVEAVEQAAIEAAADVYQQVIKNVVYGVRYEDMAVPCGKNQFYGARQRFFLCLARRLGKMGD